MTCLRRKHQLNSYLSCLVLGLDWKDMRFTMTWSHLWLSALKVVNVPVYLSGTTFNLCTIPVFYFFKIKRNLTFLLNVLWAHVQNILFYTCVYMYFCSYKTELFVIPLLPWFYLCVSNKFSFSLSVLSMLPPKCHLWMLKCRYSTTWYVKRHVCLRILCLALWPSVQFCLGNRKWQTFHVA